MGPDSAFAERGPWAAEVTEAAAVAKRAAENNRPDRMRYFYHAMKLGWAICGGLEMVRWLSCCDGMRMNGSAWDIEAPDAVGELRCREADCMCGVADVVDAVRMSLAWVRWMREIERRLAGAAPSVLPDFQLLDGETVILKAYVDGLPRCHCQTPKPKLPRVLFAGFVFRASP
jgi:hypothetical protein